MGIVKGLRDVNGGELYYKKQVHMVVEEKN